MAKNEPGTGCSECRRCFDACAICAKHARSCKYRVAATVESHLCCCHGNEVCNACDPCTCGGVRDSPALHALKEQRETRRIHRKRARVAQAKYAQAVFNGCWTIIQVAHLELMIAQERSRGSKARTRRTERRRMMNKMVFGPLDRGETVLPMSSSSAFLEEMGRQRASNISALQRANERFVEAIADAFGCASPGCGNLGTWREGQGSRLPQEGDKLHCGAHHRPTEQ